MNNIKGLPPFKRFCVTIGNLPSSYVDSMSYYECLMWLCKYLSDTVVPAVNENAEAVNELINWFNNLDVQDEIDNKLDEMTEDGTLAEILANYLDLTRFIDTTENLINETSETKIKSGYIIRTYGFYDINDGGGSDILITDTLPVDKFYYTLQNDLYGIPLTNKENVLIYGVKGDNSTDNTSILNSIKNYTKKLYFPSGTYLFNSLEISNKNEYEIYGDGYTSILKSNNPDTINAYDFISLSNGTYKVHDLYINSNYLGLNTTLSLVNTNNSLVENCKIEGSTNQRTLNLQSFDESYGYNNTINNNLVEKNSTASRSGALIECTGELSSGVSPFLHNLRITNNKCICRSTSYIGDSDLFDCIETDNCYDTIISNNYCENSMHHGISLDTRNVNTICDSNTCISTSNLTGVTRNGIEVTGTNGADLMNGIISNNIIKNFASNGISVNAKNYSIVNNRIDNSNRGILMLSLCTDGNVISNNHCSNITDYGIYLDGAVAQARITNNYSSLYIGDGTGGVLFIQTNMPGSGLNIKDGLSRIHYLNGVYKTDNYNGLNNAGYVLDMLSDGRLLFHNTTSNTWQSITKNNV